MLSFCTFTPDAWIHRSVVRSLYTIPRSCIYRYLTESYVQNLRLWMFPQGTLSPCRQMWKRTSFYKYDIHRGYVTLLKVTSAADIEYSFYPSTSKNTKPITSSGSIPLHRRGRSLPHETQAQASLHLCTILEFLACAFIRLSFIIANDDRKKDVTTEDAMGSASSNASGKVVKGTHVPYLDYVLSSVSRDSDTIQSGQRLTQVNGSCRRLLSGTKNGL